MIEIKCKCEEICIYENILKINKIENDKYEIAIFGNIPSNNIIITKDDLNKIIEEFKNEKK
jgi:hypothetical protein